MNDCKEFCDKFSDYLDGEICESECCLIEEHLKDCPPFDQLFHEFQTTVQMCKHGVSDELPETVRERLRAFLREHCKKEGTED